jgi:hypothetical protein
MSDLNLPSLQAAVSRLREIGAMTFGSGAHGFQMNPVLSESEVSAFERDHKIVLPSDYRQFVTGVGNGGAGPFYGVFPLGVWMTISTNVHGKSMTASLARSQNPFGFKKRGTICQAILKPT